ncbi:hypothetical protein B0T10DRAFT_520129 [Thelonectria olida]|uniref:Uncharacterized protein n=1 Tax=Thelonectria olida TaxID=1576542 RepID=A0A9P9AMM6_9HYPO|nr:hypothetical protein B0T10DRAFT_520129 [Thelonectria olida]
MAFSPKVHATFSISSGCLCFGSLHNIWHGSSMPVQGFPSVRPQRSGTVNVHHIEYNISAQNGTWNAFHLVDIQTKEVTAWFLALASVDPEKELDKILTVSGSPYEYDSGSTMNNDETAANGVFVINRYDWTYYDKRSWDEIGEGVEEGESDFLANSNSLGVVDLAEAKEKVLQWQTQRPSQREWSDHGVWLHIPHGEYMFGRFGFDAERTAARSFLFFSASTDFTRTSLAGLSHTLRKEETPEERFERRLREGFDFSGLQTIHSMCRRQDEPPIPMLAPLPSPPAELLGPYLQSQHLLRPQDIDALRVYRPRPQQQIQSATAAGLISHHAQPIGEFIEPWREPLFDLVNEMVMSFLEHAVLPCLDSQIVSVVAEKLFPHYTHTGRPKHLDVFCYRFFTQPHADPIANFDATYVGGQIRNFLTSRSKDNSLEVSSDCIAGICRAVAFMLTETLELANSCSRDSHRTKIMPYDVCIAVFNDSELRELMQFSKVFWEGRASLH